MIDLSEVAFHQLDSANREMLRMTLPNLGFFSLLEMLKLQINSELANMNTERDDREFKDRYAKLILERDIYEQFDILARSLNETTTEER
jgi:hypothetical protein